MREGRGGEKKREAPTHFTIENSKLTHAARITTIEWNYNRTLACIFAISITRGAKYVTETNDSSVE